MTLQLLSLPHLYSLDVFYRLQPRSFSAYVSLYETSQPPLAEENFKDFFFI